MRHMKNEHEDGNALYQQLWAWPLSLHGSTTVIYITTLYNIPPSDASAFSKRLYGTCTLCGPGNIFMIKQNNR